MSTDALSRKEKKARRQEVGAALETFTEKVEMLTLPHFNQAAVKEALSRMLSGELTTADLHDVVKEQLEKADIVSTTEYAFEPLGGIFEDMELEFSDIVRSEVDEQEVAYVPEEAPAEEQPDPAEESVEETAKAEEAAFVMTSNWETDDFDFAERPDFTPSTVVPEVTAAPAPVEEEAPNLEDTDSGVTAEDTEDTAEEAVEEQPWRSDFTWGEDDGSLAFSDQVELDVEESIISNDLRNTSDTDSAEDPSN